MVVLVGLKTPITPLPTNRKRIEKHKKNLKAKKVDTIMRTKNQADNSLLEKTPLAPSHLKF